MKKNYGFTLIELLAVIIILAVIALITTPIALNLVDNAKKKAAISSMDGYVTAANYKLQSNLISGNKIKYAKYDVIKNELGIVYKGADPTKGNYIVEKNLVTKAELCINGYSVKYENGISSLVEDTDYCNDFKEPDGVLLAELCNNSSLYENNTSFKIKKVEDLVCLSKKVNAGSSFSGKTIYLLSDIDFNDDASYTNANSLSEDINGDGKIEGLKTELTTGSGFNRIGTSINNVDNPFAGTFDGYAFTISNLYINRSANGNMGLFGYVDGGTIKGLNLKNVNVTGTAHTGGLIGNLKYGTIKEVTVSGTVTGANYVGGIVGVSKGTSSSKNTITSIISNTNVTGNNQIGAIVGNANYTTVTGVVEGGTITANNGSAGKAAGYKDYTTLNTYVSSDVNLSETSSGTDNSDDGTSYPSSYKNDKHVLGMFDAVLDTYISGDNDSSGYYYDYNEDGKITLYSTIKNPLTFDLTGSGTSADPYIVNNVDEFKQIALKNKLGYYFKINDDMDFSDKLFYQLGTYTNQFNGHLIGEAKTISNLDIKGFDYTGIIGYMSSGSVKGLNLENIKVAGKNYTGGLAGYTNLTNIYEIAMQGEVTGQEYVGGLIGTTIGKYGSSSNVLGVIVNANVTGTNYVGGITGGSNYVKVAGIIENGEIKSSGSAGKAIGFANFTTSYSYASSGTTVERTSTSNINDGTSFSSDYYNSLEYYSTLKNGTEIMIETLGTKDINGTGYVFGYNVDLTDIIVKPAIGEIATTTKEGIYYNPETNSKCTYEEYVANNTTAEVKTGCMKWYEYKESDDKVYLILDHNTTDRVVYNSTNNNQDGMIEALTALQNDTSTWDSSINPRILSANEVASIVGNNSFNSNTSGTYWFYLDTKTQIEPGTNRNYGWLIDNTSGCKSMGCNKENTNTFGWWTTAPYLGPKPDTTSYGWAAFCSGTMGHGLVSASVGQMVGIRPVVEVDIDVLTNETYSYTEKIEEYKVLKSGNYLLEVWGAQGGKASSRRGGYGAYAKGVVNLTAGDTLFVVVGGEGCTGANKTICGGYNGGGSAATASSSDYVGGGGGATHIATSTGKLSELADNKDSILIVAAGGGGAYYYSSFNSIGGEAGGITGSLAPKGTCSGRTLTTGTKANQETAGTGNVCGTVTVASGSFGLGGAHNSWSSGGGAGYYGGGSGYAYGSNGGSSYINSSKLISTSEITKSMYCYGCEESTEAGTYTVSTNNALETPTANYAKIGNGYAKITFIGE